MLKLLGESLIKLVGADFSFIEFFFDCKCKKLLVLMEKQTCVLLITNSAIIRLFVVVIDMNYKKTLVQVAQNISVTCFDLSDK